MKWLKESLLVFAVGVGNFVAALHIGSPIEAPSTIGCIAGLFSQVIGLSISLFFASRWKNGGDIKTRIMGVVFGALILIFGIQIAYRSYYYPNAPVINKSKGDTLPDISTRIRK